MIDRVFTIWRRVLSLSWPIVSEQAFSTLMRTTDIIVTGLFSPAAIVAVGLADRYANFLLRIGLGLGSGAIVLSSQETGREAVANRDEAVTQALLIGAIMGLPFVFAGFLLGHTAIEILGASPEVVELGGIYLAIIFIAAPFRHIGLTAAKAIQGTGDTKNPMYVNIGSNILNILSTVVLGLGIGVAPRLGVIGVGLATTLSRTVHALSLLVLIWSSRSPLSFVQPKDLTIARQILEIAIPRTATGISKTLADFPFNAILLLIGTEFNAGYQIGRRVYQQFSSPLSRAFRTTTSIIIGQEVGERDIESAVFHGKVIVVLATISAGVMGMVLWLGSDQLIRIFTQDQTTIRYGVIFIQVYAVSTVLYTISRVFSGGLEGGSDTRSPFIANLIGSFVVLVGVSYLFGIALGFGSTGIYAAVILHHLWLALYLGWLFLTQGWTSRALSMMDERRSID